MILVHANLAQRVDTLETSEQENLNMTIERFNLFKDDFDKEKHEAKVRDEWLHASLQAL